jgi:hypothetical protein
MIVVWMPGCHKTAGPLAFGPPPLRGALATKQSRGRVTRRQDWQAAVTRPLDCFASLAMTGCLQYIPQGRPEAVAEIAMKEGRVE